jgi:hypothetical protein
VQRDNSEQRNFSHEKKKAWGGNCYSPGLESTTSEVAAIDFLFGADSTGKEAFLFMNEYWGTPDIFLSPATATISVA